MVTQTIVKALEVRFVIFKMFMGKQNNRVSRFHSIYNIVKIPYSHSIVILHSATSCERSIKLNHKMHNYTSPFEYQARQVVSTGTSIVLMAYLDDVTGTTPSMSPLQVSTCVSSI